MNETVHSAYVEDDTLRSAVALNTDSVPKWGQNSLDRDRDAFSPAEIAVAEQVGLVTKSK